MSYNFLRNVNTITNSTLCRYDNLDGYATDFHVNGNVDGWDIYNNIYVYGCWNGVLFGTAYERACYISRNNPFVYVEAENYYTVKIMMKLTDNSNKNGLTYGRIQWTKVSDGTWNSEKQLDFDIIDDDKWHLYIINMGPAPEWQGNINNLRIYPFIDGRLGDQFHIKYIKISSVNNYTCSNTSCPYYTSYNHPCPGAGVKASCEALLSKEYYTTLSGVNDSLIINIDDYGSEEIYLSTNVNISGKDMAKVIGVKLSQLNIGGYSYSEVEHTFFNQLKILSGSTGSNSSIVVEGGSAAYELGFFDIDNNDISNYTFGIDAESGFDYTPARRLKSFEINKLIDGSKESIAYLHDPDQYNVEGGKRNFVDSSTSNVGNTSAYLMYYTLFDNVGKTLIDVSHPINDSGKLKKIYVCGVVTSAASVLILRPHKNGEFTVLYELDLPVDDDSYLYTASPVNYRIDCDILVSKGDIIAVYNADVRTPMCRRTDKPDAMFYQLDGKPSDRFDPGVCHAYGTIGFDLYARSDRLQTNIMLDIDLGERVNVEEFNVYGLESKDYFEFNIASCLDLTWDVDLFNETHWHYASHAYGLTALRAEHQNIAYGEECLDDGVRTPDNGRQGDSFYGGGNSGADITTVGHHSYFYVNGDGEWAYKYNQPGDSSCSKYEFCWPWINHSLRSFQHDPIAFTILFPYEYEINVHKSVMYFKESDNFKHFALSYYLGSYDTSGNADDLHFRYIPRYNTVTLDGVEYTEDSPAESVFKDVASYVFNNPLPWPHVIYENGECTNWGIVQTAGNVHWNVIDHEFDPITCKGFRIFCDYHNSTKINELELYSKVTVEPSLVDNATIGFSDYGENWNDGSFSEDTHNDQKITSFVGGAPRYINIEIESQSEFNLYELELIVDDKVKLENCEDVFLLDDTTSNGISDHSTIELENIYGKVCNLTVDLPRSVYVPNKVLSWMPLNSENDVTDPPVGPGGLIHKNDDYNLRMDNSQVAINNYCYGLKNLIDGKESYVYEECESWSSYETLSSGISINYSNSESINYKKNIVNFPAVSSKYWKLTSSNNYIIDSLSLFYDDGGLDVEKIYGFSAGFGFYDSLIYLGTNWAGFNIRLVINSSLLEVSSDTIKVMLSRANDTTWKFSSCFIGHASTTGDPYDFEDTPMRVTFDGGNSGATVTYDNYGSDSISFDLDESKNLVISFYFTDSSYDDVPRTEDGVIPGVRNYYKADADQSGDVDVTSYTGQNDGRSACIAAILASVEFEDGCNINTFLSLTNDVVIEFSTSIPVDQIIMFTSDTIIDLNIDVSVDNIIYAQIAGSTESRLNPDDKQDDLILSNNELTATHGGTIGHLAARSVISKSSDKWYCEFTIGDVTNNHIILGIGTENEGLSYPGNSVAGFGYYGNNGYKFNDSSSGYGDTYTTNDLIGMAIDLDDGKIWWSKNGVWQNSGVPASGTGEAFSGLSGIYYVMVSGYTPGDEMTVNFGKTSFQYSIPAGFSAFYTSPAGYEIAFDVSNYYRYFAIDFGKRHDLDIIRNYGSLSDKLFLSVGVNVEYSNTNLDDVDDVVWSNSDYNDARWIRVPLLCGDGTTRVLDKIGIYPDITVPFCHDGGYNCGWYPMGTKFTNYDQSVNIALITVVSGSSYVEDFHPYNTTDGVVQEYDYTSCWGFDAEDSSPTLYLDFGDIYTIYKIDLYHGVGEANTDYNNTDYTISISTAASGTSYYDIVSIASNTELYRSHIFDPVEVRRLKLTITGYTSGEVNFYQPNTNRHIFLNGGLLREIEVYTYVGDGCVNSEDWPVVCVDLKHQFRLMNHELFNEYVAGGSDIEWDNTEEFFKYSDSIFDDPKKVSFFRDANYITVYSSSDTSKAMEEESFYVFDTEVYLSFGTYEVLWESYDATEESELSLSAINGIYTVDSLNELTGAGWLNQAGILEIPESGYYSIITTHQFNSGNTCYTRNPVIRKRAGLIKWVSVKRNTATEYSYDDDSDKYGKDYLSRIKIYGNEKYNPFEYWWWWSSSIGTLSNNYLNVVEGSCSLEVNYPTSSGIDIISFVEGDHFGIDDRWSEKDMLSFLWYVDNINNLDLDFGAFYFGSLYADTPVYYVWNIENLNLVSGWNRIKLKFDEYDNIEPSDTYGFNDALDSSLDFSLTILKSFRIRYKGIGNSFIMDFDDLKIKRNYFEDDVKFDKGLCLTDYDYLKIPSSDISLRCGTIEFWLKPYYNHEGYDVFTNAFSRNLFTLINNNNDIISLGITSSSWFEVGFGNALTKYYAIAKDRNDVVVDGGYFERNDVIHVALVWGHNGSYIDNGDTIRFYLNGVLLLVSKYTWEVSDTKSSSLIFGGSSASIAYNSDSYGGGIFDNIKVYNYCKTEFNINRIDVYGDLPTEPNDFIQISSDGINFYDNSDGVLPFVFEDILPGEKVPIYIRTNKDDGFKNSAKKTGNLIIDWVVPV